MLVMTRKAEERIRIGDDCELTILQIDGSRVRLGFEAAREVKIMRAELCDGDVLAHRGELVSAEEIDQLRAIRAECERLVRVASKHDFHLRSQIGDLERLLDGSRVGVSD